MSDKPDPTTLQQQILYLYKSQTPEEADMAATVESNHIGFNRFDAPILTSFAEQILTGRLLSDKQLQVASLRLPKYRSQLASGDWRNISLPKPPTIFEFDYAEAEQRVYASLTKDTKGTLSIGDRQELMFTPNVYPSGQIKSIGFTRWDGKAWHQSKPSITKQAVADVKKMFGNIVVDQDIEQILNISEVGLPPEIQDNPQLFEYQKETIRFQLTYPHSLVSLAPRLGKTVTTIFAVKAANCKRVLGLHRYPCFLTGRPR